MSSFKAVQVTVEASSNPSFKVGDKVVAAVGLAQGLDLPGSMAPFILRGVTLAGIDTVNAPMAVRTEAWARLARDLDPALLESMTTVIPLQEAAGRSVQVLKGAVRGRTVVDVNS